MRLLTVTRTAVYIPPKHIKPLCLLGRDDAARTQCSPIVSQLYHPDPFCQLLGRWVRGLPIRWLDDLGVDCRVAIAVVIACPCLAHRSLREPELSQDLLVALNVAQPLDLDVGELLCGLLGHRSRRPR